jgi:prolyl-tRNA editing enzyme YbaK/EbsC (Cys-tRNA(Pro) deacylase)
MQQSQAEQQQYALAVMAADRKVDWKLLRKKLGKKSRLVAKEDVLQVSGCVSGAVPPFGSMLQTPAKTLVDVSLRDQGATINFNAVSKRILGCSCMCLLLQHIWW